MSDAGIFRSLFDDQGKFKKGDGEVAVTFLTASGAQYPGKLRFKDGLVVSATMEGGGSWGYPDESAIHGVKFLLYFEGEKPLAVFVEHGLVAHVFDVPDQVSKEKFLAAFRVARNLFVHSRAPSQSGVADVNSIADAMTRGALWLTPKVVQGFNAADFPELNSARQLELLKTIQMFKELSSELSPDKAPTREQYGNAAVVFQAILNILEPYLPTSEESHKVEKALRKVQFPPWIANWDYELGSSESGEAAIWVNVFVDGSISRAEYGRFASQIIPMIREALSAEGVQRWPYVRLKTSMEYKTA